MVTEQRNFGLVADENGFLVGIKRLADNVGNIDDNVEKILEILEGKISHATRTINAAQQLEIKAITNNTKNEYLNTQTTLFTAQPTNSKSKANTKDQQAASQADSNTSDRTRDESGRFTAGEKADGSTLSGIAKAIKSGFLDARMDTQSIDPTIDALNEVKGILSPVGKVAMFTLRPMAALFKSKKRNEPLSREEEKHNREQIRLLRRIAIAKKGGGLGNILGGGKGLFGRILGGLGGILKGGGKGLGKLLKFGKGIPFIGTALSAMSLMNWKDKTTKEKGGAVGSIAGGVIGGALGSLLGPVGTMAGAAIGSWVGNKLGGIVAPQFKNWTDALIKADIPARIGNAWQTLVDGLKANFAEKLNNIEEFSNDKINDIKNTAGRVGDFSASLMDRSLAFFGNKDAQTRVAQRERGEIGHQDKQYQPQYSNTAPSVAQVVGDTGRALTMQPSANKKYAPYLDEIAKGEARGGAFGTSGYDAIYGGTRVKSSKPISQMTLAEVKAYQAQSLAEQKARGVPEGQRSTAMGRYQFIANGKAFSDQLKAAGIKDTDIFDAATQDKLAIHYAGGKKKLDKLINAGDAAGLANLTAPIWASQKDSQGRGRYEKNGFNRATHGGTAAMQAVIDKIKNTPSTPVVQQTPQTAQAQKAPTPQKVQIPNIQTPSNINSLWKEGRPPEFKSTVLMQANPMMSSFKTTKMEVPQIETIKEPMSSPKPLMVQQVGNSTDSVGQNLSDRGLAHLVTGGLGGNGYGRVMG